MAESDSLIFNTYENEFNALAAEINDTIENKLKKSIGEKKKQLLNQLERELDEADEIVSQMDVEIRSLNTSTRIQLQPKIKEYKSELDGLKKKLKTAYNDVTEERRQLLGENNNDNVDIIIDDLDKRTKLQKNTEKLINSSKRLQNAHRMALEAEQTGASTLNVLYGQRQQMEHAQETLRSANTFLDTSTKLLKDMQRRIRTNKLMAYLIILILIILIILTIYIKWF
ncbi:V-snare-domain-containing protein [Anaeromyces robustus]|uniref:V-snare-domain-containing protein n=1 Tax=Anaeromyces robustus TaxID=1754192 RepID=A0A1Y1X4Q1_9FUNG|nr:V-snare-domain-containing protein [Anaeromyces robustus]|eukprot:ORX80625.1 V-snare-domain-containing protein [Anaeromyces robustus]